MEKLQDDKEYTYVFQIKEDMDGTNIKPNRTSLFRRTIWQIFPSICGKLTNKSCLKFQNKFHCRIFDVRSFWNNVRLAISDVSKFIGEQLDYPDRPQPKCYDRRFSDGGQQRRDALLFDPKIRCQIRDFSRSRADDTWMARHVVS